MTDEQAEAPADAPEEWLPARTVLEATLRPLLPAKWQLVTDERARDLTEQVRVTLSQRTIGHHPIAGTRMHLIGFTVTITTAATELTAAEAELDDDIEALIWALDMIDGLEWLTATKGIYDDRLGYQLSLNTATYRKAE